MECLPHSEQTRNDSKGRADFRRLKGYLGSKRTKNQSDAQELIAKIGTKLLTFEETCGLVLHPSPVVRANAMKHMIVHVDHTNSIEGILKLAAMNPDNLLPLIGTISVAHVAVACLIRLGTHSATATANELVQSWKEPDRSDLIWYLRSEAIWNKL